MNNVTHWDPKDVDNLRQTYPQLDRQQLIKLFKRKWSNICSKANKIGLKRLNFIERLDKEFILRRAKEGASSWQIAKEIGCSQQPITTFFKKNGLFIHKRSCNLPDDDIIYNYKVKKLSFSTLAKQYKCSCSPIWRILRKYSIKANKDRDYKHTLQDENLFNIINTEAKAYLLGLIAADGHLSKIKYRHGRKITHYLQLTLIDKELVLAAAELIGWKGKINYTPGHFSIILGRNCWCKSTWGFRIGSNELVSDIIKHGVTTNKSKKLKLPKIPNDLQHHFIRGFFDGDGCISFSHSKYWINGFPLFSIIGLERILRDIQNVLIKKCGVNVTKLVRVKHVTKYKMFNLCYKGKYAVIVRDYLYKDATIFLQRKYDRFFSVNSPVKNFSGYTIVEYCKKYGFKQRTVLSWIKKGIFNTKIEYDVHVISYSDGDKFAKYVQDTVSVNTAAKLLNIKVDQLYYLIYCGKINISKIAYFCSRIYKFEINKILTCEQQSPYSYLLRPHKYEVAGLFWDNIHQRWKARITLLEGRIGLGGYARKEDAIEITRRATKLLEKDCCQDRRSYETLRVQFKKEIGAIIR